jgi:hypothetical protein
MLLRFSIRKSKGSGYSSRVVFGVRNRKSSGPQGVVLASSQSLLARCAPKPFRRAKSLILPALPGPSRIKLTKGTRMARSNFDHILTAQWHFKPKHCRKDSDLNKNE